MSEDSRLELISTALDSELSVDEQRDLDQLITASSEAREPIRTLTALHQEVCYGERSADREDGRRATEALAELKTVFDQFMGIPIDNSGETFDQLVKRKYPDMKINHVHHAGNSSGVVGGAAALILSNKAYADKVGWKPRARIKAIATVGGDPTLMLNEPVTDTRDPEVATAP